MATLKLKRPLAVVYPVKVAFAHNEARRERTFRMRKALTEPQTERRWVHVA